MKQIVFFGLALSVMASSYGQLIRGPINYPAPGVLDGTYVPENIPTKRVVPYEHIREADVTWSKRVWSVIDLRQKFNHPLFYPMDELEGGMWNKNANYWSLWTVIRYHVLNGDLTLYSPFNPDWEEWKDGDSFKYPITPEKPGGNYYTDSAFREKSFIYFGREIEQIPPIPYTSNLDPTQDSMRYDPILEQWEVVYIPNDTVWFSAKDIVQYKLKEDWIFDKDRSVTERRVIGIAPVIYQRDVNGNITGLRELFWLYFPECRYVFQNFFVRNRHNDSQMMSLDDLFWKRMYHSFIVKESNNYDRAIDSYKAGVDALLESEAIKARLDDVEHDLWAF